GDPVGVLRRLLRGRQRHRQHGCGSKDHCESNGSGEEGRVHGGISRSRQETSRSDWTAGTSGIGVSILGRVTNRTRGQKCPLGGAQAHFRASNSSITARMASSSAEC
ncbi:MAG: hypothetical protein ACK55I_29505, partial [bacterium]